MAIFQRYCIKKQFASFLMDLHTDSPPAPMGCVPNYACAHQSRLGSGSVGFKVQALCSELRVLAPTSRSAEAKDETANSYAPSLIIHAMSKPQPAYKNLKSFMRAQSRTQSQDLPCRTHVLKAQALSSLTFYDGVHRHARESFPLAFSSIMLQPCEQCFGLVVKRFLNQVYCNPGTTVSPTV